MNEFNELRIWHELCRVSSDEVPFPIPRSVLLTSAKIGKSQAGY